MAIDKLNVFQVKVFAPNISFNQHLLFHLFINNTYSILFNTKCLMCFMLQVTEIGKMKPIFHLNGHFLAAMSSFTIEPSKRENL